ncbi:MAG TPA: ANTAR domain-containing protein [Angustibacter sp.]|nr:ANTAR domain-containing protein [Angustibacter sp.]
MFDAQPVPTVLLDRDLAIRAVTPAYAGAVTRPARELLGRAMFDAFPDNPDDPDADGVANLARSFETAVRQRRPHHMLVQRYDIVDQCTSEWLPRVWSPVNSPVIDGSEVVGLMHQVRDVTPLGSEVISVLHRYRDLLRKGPRAGARAHQLADHADAVAALVADTQAFVTEVMDLRRALTSRATIEQAKGIVMAERRCSPDDAFEILRRLSNDSNVRVADVALALVYKAQAPEQA